MITVRVVDDSPEDMSNPAAAYAMDVIVVGKDEEDNAKTLTSDPDLVGEGIEWEPALEPVVEGRQVGDRWEAVGQEEMISFIFTMPEGFQPTEADFVARVGGDYRIYSDFPLVIKGENSNRITGRGDINGGGDLIKLRTMNGDIHIRLLKQ